MQKSLSLTAHLEVEIGSCSRRTFLQLDKAGGAFKNFHPSYRGRHKVIIGPVWRYTGRSTAIPSGTCTEEAKKLGLAAEMWPKLESNSAKEKLRIYGGESLQDMARSMRAVRYSPPSNAKRKWEWEKLARLPFAAALLHGSEWKQQHGGTGPASGI
jgi:hypothetical protein